MLLEEGIGRARLDCEMPWVGTLVARTNTDCRTAIGREPQLGLELEVEPKHNGTTD